MVELIIWLQQFSGVNRNYGRILPSHLALMCEELCLAPLVFVCGMEREFLVMLQQKAVLCPYFALLLAAGVRMTARHSQYGDKCTYNSGKTN